MTDHHRSLDRALACTCPPSVVSPSCPTHGRRWGGEAAQGTDVEALAEVIGCVSEFRPRVCTVIARAILASAWLERHDAETIEAAESAAGDAVAELVDALRLTVEYVGTETLPLKPGWSWWDALSKYAPKVAAQFVPGPCSAALNLAGEHFGCDGVEGHSGAHSNPDAEAIWADIARTSSASPPDPATSGTRDEGDRA